MKLTFEGTEEQLDLLKDEFEMLRVEHGNEKLPSMTYLFHYGKKQRIAEMLVDIFDRIEIDRPNNFDEILYFVVDDVFENAGSDDVAMAFKRYLQSKN